MFIVPAGGLDIAKNTLAPHTKMINTIASGAALQPISSSMLPRMFAPMASGVRRRYLIAYQTINPAIRSEKNTVRATRKKYNASTRLAIVEADSGKRGVPDHISGKPRELEIGDEGLAVLAEASRK
jgi:hypothetical protein